MDYCQYRKKTLLITGSSGYLAQLFIDKVLQNNLFERVVGFDVRPPDLNWLSKHAKNFSFYKGDVRNYRQMSLVFAEELPVAVLHLAWVFNPLHDAHFQWQVDVLGSVNVFGLCDESSWRWSAPVEKLIYMGSTTAYVNPKNPNAPPFIKETEPVSGTDLYLYSKHKAIVDRAAQDFIKRNPIIDFTLFRGAIILGAHTRNIVSQMAEWSLPGFSKYMFQVKGFDPPMQFLSEDDFVEILFRALSQDKPGIYNLAGDGTLRYSEIIEALGRKPLPLPAGLLYKATESLWRARCCPFPSGILDLIRYPWVADNSKLKKEFGYVPKKTSHDALAEFVAARNQKSAF